MLVASGTAVKDRATVASNRATQIGGLMLMSRPLAPNAAP